MNFIGKIFIPSVAGSDFEHGSLAALHGMRIEQDLYVIVLFPFIFHGEDSVAGPFVGFPVVQIGIFLLQFHKGIIGGVVIVIGVDAVFWLVFLFVVIGQYPVFTACLQGLFQSRFKLV